jgi:tetratricopeptide (TPR) repeat protein
MPFDNLFHRFSELIFNGCFPSSVHDQLAGELVKARLMKASKRFDEALEVINKTLDRLPDYPEALLLKAQILWEGYSDYPAAKACLQHVLQMEKMRNEKDKTVRRWCANLLKEMLEEKRAQNRRAEADKRRR